MKNCSKLLRKIGLVLMPISTVGILNGCTHVYSLGNAEREKENIEATIIEKTSSRNQNFIYLNGCTSSETTRRKLILIAGIYAGTIKVGGISGKYKISGFYDKKSSPEVLELVIKEADKNNNCMITWEEADDLEEKILSIKNKK